VACKILAKISQRERGNAVQEIVKKTSRYRGAFGLARLQPLTAFWLLSLVVVAVRLVVAGQLELMEDESYYWLWSRDLQLSYYDHPAMVAWLIAAGTSLFGDSPVAIRLPAILLNLATARVLFALAHRVFGSARIGLTAALWFYACLMFNVIALIVTPDAPLLLCWSLMLLAAVGLIQASKEAVLLGVDPKGQLEGQWRWWGLLALAAGLGALSKYTILLMAPPLAALFLGVPLMRRWLVRPQPYVAAVAAAAVASPLLLWNAANGWIGLGKQWNHAYGAVAPKPAQWLAELVASELGVITPLLLIGLLMASWWGLREGAKRHALTLQFLAVSCLLPLAFFLLHTLNGRVQAHWPAPAFLSAVVLAAGWLHRAEDGAVGRSFWVAGRGLGRWAVISGLGLSLIVYGQAVHPWLPISQQVDPTRRLSGWQTLGQQVTVARQQTGVGRVLTMDYALASQIAYYTRGFNPYAPMVFTPDAMRRFPNVDARAVDALMGQDFLYITRADGDYDQQASLQPYFESLTALPPPFTPLTLYRDGQEIRRLNFYLAKGYRGGLIPPHIN